ncbi:hypothetical protein B296_00047634 [Ensete ventricosum]|uniref:Uncharacterized protein n=1 Tax=Ensete ventricosum TaxID=4639 RepID=A0A426WYH7_ENSVE|nr:hypothetical protein B296_00047634 [Ensete ventricosum]
MASWVLLLPSRSRCASRWVGSSFSQKDALALFPHPHYIAVATPTHVMTTLVNRQPPCQRVVGATAPCGLATPAGAALQVVMPVGDYRPYVGGLGHSWSPLCRGPWPQPTAPLQVASRPYRWSSHDRPPPFLTMFAAKTQQEHVE